MGARTIIAAVVAAFLSGQVTGCSKSISDARNEDEFYASVKISPELQEVDAKLDDLATNTQSLEDSYNGIQATVLAHTTFSRGYNDVTKQVSVYINENNVLVVNDRAMSKNDFSSFANKNLPALCSPTPRLAIHPKANYDTAAWVLESIYAHGCPNVDVD